MTQCSPKVLVLDGPVDDFTIGSDSGSCPIIVDSNDDEAIHIAARTFALDVGKVVGSTPEVVDLALAASTAVIACTIGSQLAASIGDRIKEPREILTGKWESFHVSVVSQPLDGIQEALVVLGSDRVCDRGGTCADGSEVSFTGCTRCRIRWECRHGTGGATSP